MFFLGFLQEFCPPFQLAAPPAFQANRIPKGKLVYAFVLATKYLEYDRNNFNSDKRKGFGARGGGPQRWEH